MENAVKTAIRCITFTQTVSYRCLAATGLYANSQALFHLMIYPYFYSV